MLHLRRCSLFALVLAGLVILAGVGATAWSQDDDSELVTDVYCKMIMPKRDMSDTWVYQGVTYWFCSADCKNEVMGDPKKYTGVMATSKEIAGFKVNFLTKPVKVHGGLPTRLILEIHPDEGRSLSEITKIDGKLNFTFTPPGGATTKSTDQQEFKPYIESGIYGITIKMPGKGYCDVEVTLKTAASTGKETFHFEILESREEATGTEYNAVPFTMVIQHQSMHKVGFYWRELYDLITSEKPDFDTAGKYLARVTSYSELLKKFTPHKYPELKEEHAKLTQEYLGLLTTLKTALETKSVDAAIKSYNKIEGDGCTKCHIKFRWDVVRDISRFPDLSLPAK